MDIRRCYDILELKTNASLAEVKRAYKDIVNVWHPDRFSNNPRLKEKAEEKLKEINKAYETLTVFLSRESKAERVEKDEAPPSGDRTEAVVEAGTRMVLGAAYYLYKNIRRYISVQMTEAKSERSRSGHEGKKNQPKE